MSKGHVQWFSEALGYGFIETPNGARVLVRPAAFDQPDDELDLREGTEVEFSIRSRDDGVVEARSVTVSESANA